jgi:uncharacterized membrane protein
MSPKVAYVTVNAFLIGILFTIAINGLRNLTNRRFTKYMLVSPVILLSLYLNWDLWAITPLLFSMIAYQSQKYLKSAVLLGISISVKFFPIVLLLPILLYFYRTGRSRLAIKFVFETCVTWLLINLPFIVISPSGWSRFYLYSLERGLGEGSIFALPSKLGLEFDTPMIIYTLVNLLTFFSLIAFLILRKSPVRIEEASFLAVAAFTAFGKQYSIQYVLWLTPLAILSIHCLVPKDQKRIFPYFVLWQIGEFFMYYGYFQNMWKVISNEEYAFWAITRYFLFFLFTYKLLSVQLSLNSLPNLARKKK